MVSLTPDEVWDLKIKFLSNVTRLCEEKLKTSINASEAWDRMDKQAFDKKTVFPFIVSELIEGNIIKRGDNPDEVIIINRYAKSKRIRVLEIFNDFLNHSESENSIGITLNLHGITVTGSLISLRTYYRKMQNAMSQGDTSNAWNALFEDLIHELPKNEEEWQVLTDIIGIGYVCLKEAKYVMGSTFVPTDNAGMWIGRIESVDSFMIGTLKANKGT